MAIEPPNPNNIPAIDALRAALPALHEAARHAPSNPLVIGAIGHVGAAIALLETPYPSSPPRPSA